MSKFLVQKNVNFKLLKYKYKQNILLKILQNTNFVLFFFYDFFDSKSRADLFSFLNKHNLKSHMISNKIVKTTLKEKKYKDINVLLENNVIALYDKTGSFFDTKIIKQLIKRDKLNLIFCLWDKKIYRHKQLEKIVNQKVNSHVEFIQLLNHVNKSMLFKNISLLNEKKN